MEIMMISNSSMDDDKEEEEEELLRSDTSSIGVCSSSVSAEAEADGIRGEEEEVESRQEEPDLDANYSTNLNLNASETSASTTNTSSLASLDSLQDSLPFKRGLSNFYSGKSKSFTSLSNVANATAKDLVKPDNPLNKRRRLLIAWSHNRRASCSNLISIAESSLLPLPLPPVLSECAEEEEDEEDEDENEEAAEAASATTTTTTMMRRTRSEKEKKRPSLFTVAVTRQVFTEYDNDPPATRPLLTPKPSITGSKMALRLPGRSFSLSDLNQHAHAHAPP